MFISTFSAFAIMNYIWEKGYKFKKDIRNKNFGKKYNMVNVFFKVVSVVWAWKETLVPEKKRLSATHTWQIMNKRGISEHGSLTQPPLSLGFCYKAPLNDKTLSDPHSVLIPQLLSLKVARRPAEAEINGNGFCKDEASFRSYKSLQMPSTHPTSVPGEGAKAYKLCLTARHSLFLAAGPAQFRCWSFGPVIL